MTRTRTQTLVLTAMLAALTLMATSILKIQTPTFGYIHIGDAFVLLSGILLGPLYGGAAAGIGSALSDLLGGYAIWVPGTFLIKFFTAFVAGLLYRAITRRNAQGAGNRREQLSAGRSTFAVLFSGIPAEAVMVAGYFFYNILIVSLTNGSFARASIASAFALSAAEIPFNLIQGGVGILLSLLLVPVFSRITRTAAAQSTRGTSRA